MPIDPIVTLAVDTSMLHAPEAEPSIGMLVMMELFRFLGIHFVTIDGQLMPGAVLLFALAVWGVYHISLMAYNAATALPGLHRKIKRYFDERNS